MTKILLILFTLILTKPFSTKAQDAFLLKVEVKGFKSTIGTVKLQMVDKDNKEVYTKVASLTKKSYTFDIKVYNKGQYAINIIHDKNNNNKLDTNLFGIPKEGWGCSNDARGVMSAPKFKDKLFILNQDKSITINLVHY